MSWLLVAFIPGLLMLATFGLDRIEARLADDAEPEDDLTALLELVKAEAPRRPLTAPDAGPPGTLPHREVRCDPYAVAQSEAYLPTRVYVHHSANPQFQPTRQADRV